MSEKKEFTTISRYAIFCKKLHEADNDKLYWRLPIARLHSGKRKTGLLPPEQRKFWPAFCSNGQMKTGELSVNEHSKFRIAVRDIIIEWEDYQAEFCGYIYCSACDDQVERSAWLSHVRNDSDDSKEKNENESKQLLRFGKSPGRKTTIVKIETNDLKFHCIDLNQCLVLTKGECRVAVRREHYLECEIRSLFDENEILPIKNALITVEIYVE